MENAEKTRAMLSDMLVTIDGPAGSGKSTTASLLAKRLDLIYLDTGAMYRAVTWCVLEEGFDPADEEKITKAAKNIELELRIVDNTPLWFINGKEAGSEIREPAVSAAVSPVSKHAGVRRSMVKLQRKIATQGGIVAEGRDTGTTVFPFAHVKIFLVADIESRAQRRVEQMRLMGIDQDIDLIRANIAKRDEIDSTREHSPLLRSPGAILVDTSHMTIDQQVGMIERIVIDEAEKLAALRVWPGEKNPNAHKPIYWAVTTFFVSMFYKFVFGLKIFGEDNLDYRENYIFASNHISYSDPPLIGSTVGREIWFMAKKELFQNRLLGWLIRKYHAIPINRGEADRKSIRTISGKLDDGYSILLFPEGTRSRTGKIRKLKSGLGFMALQTGTAIAPLFISGANSMKKCFLRKKRLEIRIGKPIRVNSTRCVAEDKKRDYQTLASMVWEEMRMLQDESKA